MKKTLLLFYFLFLSITSVFAQTDFYEAIPSDGATSSNARAPHGRYRYQRGVVLIKATEMAASGLVNGDIINSIAFKYLVAQNIPTTATMTLYLENTSDVTNLKPTTWSVVGMTSVSSGTVTIPNTTGLVSFDSTTNFTYTGGGVYVAFDYQNATSPLPTSFVTVDCNSTGLVSGFKGAQSDAAVQTTIAASSFRPVIFLGKSVACAKPINLGFNTPSLNSANLLFSATSGGTVDIEYGTYNFTQGTGTTVTNVTSPYTVNSLVPSTVYDFYVRKNCGSGVYSAWEGPFMFHTQFQPTTATYTTGFEQIDFPYIGWLAFPNTTSNDWFINIGGTGSTLVQEGVAAAIAITPTASAATQSLFSRGINLTAGSAVTIKFYDRNYVSTTAPISTNTASYTLSVGTNQTDASQTTSLYSTTGLSTTTFTQRTVNFVPTFTGAHYFRFQNISPANATGTHAIIIDNFVVTEVLGTDEFSESKFSIYPNPTSSILNISNTNNVEIKSISVVDINGRIVKNQSDSLSQINVSDLNAGVYFVTIEAAEGKTTKKFIKQ